MLWGAGAFGVAPATSGTLMRWGRPGPGRWITVYANSEHMFVIVAGLRFDTARYDRGPNAGESGPRWRLGPRPMQQLRRPSPRRPVGEPMLSARPRLLLLAALGCALLTACSDPYASSSTAPRPTPVAADPARGPVDGEVGPGAPIGPQPTQSTGPRPWRAASPAAAARRAVTLAGTWTPRTAADRYQALAAMAIGAARRDAEQVAAQLHADTAAGQASSESVVEAVTIRGAGPRRRAIVVSRERVEQAGVDSRRWRVTLLKLVADREGWAVARWEPQP